MNGPGSIPGLRILFFPFLSFCLLMGDAFMMVIGESYLSSLASGRGIFNPSATSPYLYLPTYLYSLAWPS